MGRVATLFCLCLFVYCAFCTDAKQKMSDKHYMALTNPLAFMKLPFIVFPANFQSGENEVVESLMWQNAGYSDLVMTASVIPTNFSVGPVMCCAAGTIFSKDMDGQNYGRVETHSGGYVSVFGFGIGGI